MKRKGIHKPTVEDAIEISGIEILHPGGYELTKRTAEFCELKEGMRILDVSSGRGTQAIYYAETFGVDVTGIDISDKMVETATKKTTERGLSEKVRFIKGDSQDLPFKDNTFDVVINECAVGIPDDSQKVLNEMLRVVKQNGAVAIHESVWKKPISGAKKEEISERYGTTPLELTKWVEMLEIAGAVNIISESEKWSEPEMFWNIRKDRKVKNHKSVMSIGEKLTTAFRVLKNYGFDGVKKVFENEKFFFQAVLSGVLGYALFKGVKQTDR
ncbi:MAG: class I SAM-dependent methyltransferase [Bacteroidetes bacterium]|nr:class I SAM-dependent methyltransferase [Bacteroidota bacterium]